MDTYVNRGLIDPADVPDASNGPSQSISSESVDVGAAEDTDNNGRQVFIYRLLLIVDFNWHVQS